MTFLVLAPSQWKDWPAVVVVLDPGRYAMVMSLLLALSFNPPAVHCASLGKSRVSADSIKAAMLKIEVQMLECGPRRQCERMALASPCQGDEMKSEVTNSL